jgi:pimeloyl-ACP methyl ester carboxylesterase
MQLPEQHWGTPGGRRVLLVHGLNGNSATWWRVAEHLAANGWHVTAVDLRGHGAAAPGDDLALSSYAADLPGSDWDLVVGHSLGGATSTLAAGTPGFTRRLVLLDPVLKIDPAERDAIIEDQVAELSLTVESLGAAKPHWDARDVELKVAGARLSSLRTARESFDDNPGWNAVDALSALPVPTLILSGDPAIYSMLATSTALAIVAVNPLVTYRVVAGTGHSPQRDDFEATITQLEAWV